MSAASKKRQRSEGNSKNKKTTKTKGNSESDPKRRRYNVFSQEEVDSLIAGVGKYGEGQWKQIHDDPEFPFKKTNRTVVDLKDKWRVIQHKRRREKHRPVLMLGTCTKIMQQNERFLSSLERGISQRTSSLQELTPNHMMVSLLRNFAKNSTCTNNVPNNDPKHLRSQASVLSELCKTKADQMAAIGSPATEAPVRLRPLTTLRAVSACDPGGMAPTTLLLSKPDPMLLEIGC